MQRPRRALVLCGGGATGAAYEVGALAALEASLPGFRIQHFDIFVGTSAGALIATLMATGVSAARMYHALTAQDDFFPLRRADVYGVEPREVIARGVALLDALRRLGAQVSTGRGRDGQGFDLADLARALPDGLFTLHRYQRFIERLLERHGLPQTFDAVERHLLVPANNLDTGHREVFGHGYRLDASLAQAIAASSAIPLFFAPMRIGQTDLIDGGTGKVAHTDLAVGAGATHVLVINPIVPWNLARRLSRQRRDQGRVAPGSLTRIRERGLWGIWNQAFRVSTLTRLYLDLHRFRAERPDVGLALISPSEEDETLFVTSPMSTDARATVARHAFESTRAHLRDHGDAVRAVCRGEPDACKLDGVRQPEVADTSWRED